MLYNVEKHRITASTLPVYIERATKSRILPDR